MPMYSFLGWFFVAILAVMVLPYVLKLVMKHSEKARKNTLLKTLLKITRKMHRYIILIILVLAPVHAYLALGANLQLHTGSILYLGMLLVSIGGFIFYKTKNKKLIKFHKIGAGLVFILLFIHIVYPNLLWTLTH